MGGKVRGTAKNVLFRDREIGDKSRDARSCVSTVAQVYCPLSSVDGAEGAGVALSSVPDDGGGALWSEGVGSGDGLGPVDEGSEEGALSDDDAVALSSVDEDVNFTFFLFEECPAFAACRAAERAVGFETIFGPGFIVGFMAWMAGAGGGCGFSAFSARDFTCADRPSMRLSNVASASEDLRSKARRPSEKFFLEP